MSVKAFRDIPYYVQSGSALGTSSGPPSPFHLFNYYVPLPTAPDSSSSDATHRAVICFVHGGAWRSEDKSDWAELADRLVRATGCAVAVPNYKLSPRETAPDVPAVHHPEHALDILRFLTFLNEWNGPPGSSSGTAKQDMILLGHSCSAHMLFSIFMDASSSADPLRPSDSLASAVRGIATSQGMYDIDHLLAVFPNYRSWFIEAAFGARPSYADVSVTRASLRPTAQHIQWLIIHNPPDPLIDVSQSNLVYQHLLTQYQALGMVPDQFVRKHVENLAEGHNEALDSHRYCDIIQKFIHRVV